MLCPLEGTTTLTRMLQIIPSTHITGKQCIAYVISLLQDMVPYHMRLLKHQAHVAHLFVALSCPHEVRNIIHVPDDQLLHLHAPSQNTSTSACIVSATLAKSRSMCRARRMRVLLVSHACRFTTTVANPAIKIPLMHGSAVDRRACRP